MKLEYVGKSHLLAEAKLWNVEAIHVTVTGNKRKFTERELELGGRSLAFRHVDINHDMNQILPHVERGDQFLNSTLSMKYAPEKKAVVGQMQIIDERVNHMIETGEIDRVSIEQIPLGGETCNKLWCEQHDVAFVGLGLLTKGTPPGDPRAGILREAIEMRMEKISNLIVSNAQRKCQECTDFAACHKCAHKEQDDQCVERWIKELSEEHPEWPRDQVVAVAFDKCRKSESIPIREAKQLYKKCCDIYDRIYHK